MILFISSKRRLLKARDFAIIFIFSFIPFTTHERPALQNKQVVLLRMARKVLGTFEKRAPGPWRLAVQKRSLQLSLHAKLRFVSNCMYTRHVKIR